MTEVLAFAAMGTTGHLEGSGPQARRLARSAITQIDGRSLASGPILTPSGRQARSRYVPLKTSPLRIDRQARTVTLDPGAGLDPGGLAKGFSADLVLAELVGEGALSALVDIGGDMAFASVDGDDRRCRRPSPWTIPSSRVWPSIA